MFIVFDLDGTLTDTTHRQYILRQNHIPEKERWQLFHDACDKDERQQEVINILEGLVYPTLGNTIEIWTGRCESTREKTEKWLKYNVDMRGVNVPVRMRPIGDDRPDREIKRGWIHQYGVPALVFEDRNTMVQWWRKFGIVCCQVSETIDII